MPGHPWIELTANYLKIFPTEARRSIEHYERSCGAFSAVKQSFVRYIRTGNTDREFIALHFDRFRCDDRSQLCRKEGYLHQIYAPVKAGYRLVFGAHVPDVEVKIINGTPAVEVEREGGSAGHCRRVYLWRGNRLLEQR